MDKAKMIFFGNYKGGVGKTTSAFQIGGWMANHGKKVLMIDLDPQSSLSTICANCGGKKLEEYRYNETLNYAIELYSRYINNEVNDFKLLTNKLDNLSDFIKDIIVPIPIHNITGDFKFIPSSIVFKNARLNDLAQRMSNNNLNIFVMKLILEDLECSSKYDFIIFDCPPTSNILTQSVFLLSDYYIIPTICDEISANGVPDYISEIESIHAKYCMNNEIGGILINALFGEKAKLIGVFETLYKERRRSADNMSIIQMLDKNIGLLGIDALISDSKFAGYRYNKVNNGVDTNYIFEDYIRHLDGRTTGTSMAMHITKGWLHDEYEQISNQILDILK